MQHFNQFHCVKRARELLETGDAANLRYAALELRYAMEYLTYEKLEAAGSHIPPHVIDKWQPPQAVRALLEYEPNGDKGFQLFVGIQDEAGVPAKEMAFVGAHKPLGLGWLRKNYNKVGQYLHAHRGNARRMNNAQLRSYLSEVADEITAADSGSIVGGAFVQPFDVTCEKCGQVFVIAKHSLESTHDFYCFNPNCRAEYYGKLTGENSAVIKLKRLGFKCGKCDSTIGVEERYVKEGHEFSCNGCGAKHRIYRKQWAYASVDSGTS